MQDKTLRASESVAQTIIGDFKGLDCHAISVGDVLTAEYTIRSRDENSGTPVISIVIHHKMSQAGKDRSTRYRDENIIKGARVYFEDGRQLHLLVSTIEGYLN